MNYQVILYSISSFSILILSLVVYLKNPKKLQNQVFSLFILFGFFYITSLAVADIVKQPDISLWALKIGLIFTNFIGFLLIWLATVYPTKLHRSKQISIIAFALAVMFSIIVLTPNFISNVVITSSGADLGSVGFTYYLQQLFIISCIIIGLLIFGRRLKKANSLERSQIRFIIYITIFYAFINAVMVNVLPLFFDLPGVGPLLTAPSSLILFAGYSYVIIRHRLFDIRFIVARSITYIFTIGFIAFVYSFIIFRFASVFISKLSPQLQQTVYVVLTVILAFTFAPLRRFFERISNRIFYRDRYDSQELVNEIGRILASEIDLDKVSSRVLHELSNQIKIDKAEIIVFGENQLFYENNVFKNGGGQISPDELSKLGRIMVVRDDIQTSDKKELMQKYGISISLALRTSEKFIGYMLLGEKKSGDIYNDQDLAVLKIIANEVSVAMANALSYKEIQLFSETLAEKVRQRTGQLRHANDQLKELDKAKDEFISMASHQLRTPLTTVKGYASMLEEGDFGKLTKEQSKIVEQTLDGSNRMARLIDDLLNVSRMDANRFFLEANQVDLNKLIPEELEQLKSFAESKKVELTYVPPKQKIPIIQIDENKTRQVVMNLVDNALHYSAPPAGGGHVKVSLVLNGDFVEFWVADDGIGVPAAVQKKLFTKMFRAPNAQGVRPDGTGLGLYLVKRVVEQQGGEIWFESKEGKGSTFGFKLPLSGIPKHVLEESKKIGAKVAASHAKSGN